MKKAVIYWSGTGNTAAMASAIAAGMGEGTELYSVDQFTGDIAEYDKIAFGCPQWVTKFWKKANLIPSSPLSKASWAAKRLLCLVLTVGATDSGCATGQKEQQKQARTCMTMVCW